MTKLNNYFKRLFSIIDTQSVKLLPGNIAFFLVLSLFPLLTLLGLIATRIGVSSDGLINLIDTSLPSSVSEVLDSYIIGKGFDTNIGIFMIIGFILASNGAHSIIIASNSLYGFPNSNYLKRRIKSVFIILLLIGMFIFMLGFVAFGNYIVNYIITNINDIHLSKVIHDVFNILKWPFSILIIFLNVKLIYLIAPDSKLPLRHTTKGAIFTTVFWILIVKLYSYWITNFANYDLFYGSLSNIAILMLLTYFISYILVLGIAINVRSYEYKIED